MNKELITIWGKNLELDIIYDCYSGEEILDKQKESYFFFLKNGDEIEKSLDKVKQYCLTNNEEEIGTNDIENIFRYVMPKYIYISREVDKHLVSIMCNYKFDQDNGIAIVFENEKFQKIGPQDIIL